MNVINYPFIDYIIKCYVPEIQKDQKFRYIKMDHFREAMVHHSYRQDTHSYRQDTHSYRQDTHSYRQDTHSYRQDTNKVLTYERLEYLGDAIFHMLITDYLYERYPDENEGFLTKLRIKIERGDSMVHLSEILQLQKFVQTNNLTINNHILEDIFESFIGAFYLNFGMVYTKKFIVSLIEKHKDLSSLIIYDDNYKDLLLRYFHKMKWGHPIYLESISDSKFVSKVENPEGKCLGKGYANSKKKADQVASKKALEKLGVIKDDVVDADWQDKIENHVEEEKNGQTNSIIYNKRNKLMTYEDLIELLKKYDITPSTNRIKMKSFHEAMTHRSYLKRKNKIKEEQEDCVPLQKKSNERLQFLGDTIIHFIIGEYLFSHYPDEDEGFLTRIRSKIENKEALYQLAKRTTIDEYLLISENIENIHKRENVNIIGGCLEAFIGNLYLVFGLEITKAYFISVIENEIKLDVVIDETSNYKDLILQLYNKNGWGCPVYRVLNEKGPEHSKIFTMGIYLHNKLMGKGSASSKKKAEQMASKVMYERIKK